ncbi:MAG: diaminopimelate epimerase [Cyanobacteriota bacterium]|nr:diaminopimelate epimerase [Cyanobacteriota bacterium]
MKTIKITKMQGCGNDFVILDYSEYEKTGLSMSDLAKKLCDRHFGIGADGMIIPDTKQNGETDIAWSFYNSDGTTAQMCGNGMRCFAKYVYDNKLVDKKTFSVKTLAGIIKPEILTDGKIKVNMGTPILEDEKIPFKGERIVHVKDREFQITPVSMGNPHCIIFTEEDPMVLAKTYGPDMEIHPYFPEKTNTEFVKVISRNEIEMRVYERGCGITLACGTGACASTVACVLNNLTENNVKVNLLGGAVNVEWSGTKENPNKDIFLIGPAEYSFKVEYML